MPRQLKFLPLLLLLIAACLPLSAEEYDNEFTKFNNLSLKHRRAQCALVNSLKSPCNSGTEPFLTFIKKFKKSKKFLLSRAKAKEFINVTDIIDEARRESMANTVLAVLKEPINTKYCNPSWYDVQKDEVSFIHMDESWVFLKFKRINGKWYLSFIQVIG